MSDQHLIGTEFDDVLTGGDGNDWLEGLGGDDTLTGGFGNNFLDGGAGSDTVDYTLHYNGYVGVFVDLGAGYASFLDVVLVDGSPTPIPYTDTLVSIENAEGSDFDDTLIGSAAANRLSGLGGADHLEGGAGDDVLDGGSGVDQLDGGDGDDAFIIASSWDHESYPWAIETITGGAGNDVIRFTSTASGDVLHLTSTTSGVETIVISDAAGDTSGTTALSINARFMSYGVTLIGNDGANFLNGTVWDDSLFGGGGDDNIVAGGGNNLYDGGAGSDTVLYSGLITPLFVDLEAGYGFFADSFWQDGEEFVFESTDTLIGVENIESGDGDDQLSGSAAANRLSGWFGNDVLLGRDGDDSLFGGGGDDTLDGGAGNNLLDGGAGSDTVYYNGSIGPVFVDLGAGYAIFFDLDLIDGQEVPIQFTDTLVDIENVESSGTDDQVLGNSAANRLSGMGGNDFLSGLDGNDLLDGGSGADQMDGGDGDDTFLIAVGWDHDFSETIAGGAGNDVIRFTSANWGEQLTLNSATSGVESIVVSDATGDTSGTTALNVNAKFVLSNGVTIIGNDGANFLVGTWRADSLFGGGGDDTLAAGSGNNLYDGGAGSDTVNYGGVSGPVFVDLGAGYAVFGDLEIELTDTLIDVENVETSDGDDTLIGSAAVNSLSGMGGNDYLDGAGGQDTMLGGAGDDTYVVDDSGDWVTENAGEGVDTVESSVSYQIFDHIENLTLVGAAMGGTGNTLDNVITGHDGDNQIFGHGGNDTLIGGGGNDYMVAGEGSDLLAGGAGDDFMLGLGGDDIYEPGTGGDIIYDSGGDDEVRMAPGIDPDQVSRTRHSSGTNLELRIAGTNDMVSFYNWFQDPSFRIERVVFDDGTVWTIEDLESLHIVGTAGDDPGLVGSVWSETIIGFTGSDSVSGDGGDDVIFLQADGSDWVQDFSGDDEVHWQGVDPDQVERIHSSGWENGLILRVAGTTDTLTLAYWFNTDPYGDPYDRVERVVFDDGTVWDADELGALRIIGTPFDDFLSGSPSGEQIEGREGNDYLAGWTGDDVYFQGGPGFGEDTVWDTGGVDELRFGAGIAPFMIERIVSAGGNDLILRVAGTTDSVRLANWFFDPSFQIEQVVFADGTVWTPQETEQPAYNLGTPGDDVLVGSEASEYFNAFAGSDTLLGGAGDDTYVLEAGGQDHVQDTSGYDAIYWKGVSSQEVETMRESGSNDLVLRVAGTIDTLTLSGWFTDPANQIERIVFDDGNALEPWSASVLWRKGGPGDDFMQGNEYSEALQGRGGNDVMIGAGGDDVLIGDSGDDVYYVGVGHDWVNEFTGDDEVHFVGVTPDQVSRIREPGTVRLKLLVADSPDKSVTLTNQFSGPIFEIERVIFDDGTVWDLAELADLRYVGTAGNDHLVGTDWSESFEGLGGDDVLEGRGGDDRLDGGAGQDRLEGGAGDDTYIVTVEFAGVDVISDAADASGGNRVVIDALPADWVQIGYDGDSMVLHYFGWEFVRIEGFDRNDVLGGHRAVQQFSFFDATLSFEELVGRGFDIYDGDGVAEGTNLDDRVWGSFLDDQLFGLGGDDQLSGSYGNDSLFGGEGNDVLQGDEGNDRLDGGSGADTYQIWQGSGLDVIAGSSSLAEDRLEFGAGIWSGDVSVTRAADNLTLSFGFGNEVSVEGYFLPGNALAIEFTEGGSWDAATIERKLVATDDLLTGSESADALDGGLGDDSLYGNGGNDFLAGDAGDDVLDGGAGDDVLDGGAGDDWMEGGAGADTYLFGVGYGHDVIAAAAPGDSPQLDRIRLQAVYSESQLQVSQQGSDLAMRITSTGDILTIAGWFADQADRIGQIEFGDGRTISADQIEAHINRAPVVVNPIADQTVQVHFYQRGIPLAGAFADPGDSISFSVGLTSGDPLPGWMRMVGPRDLFFFAPPEGSEGTYSLRVTATDSLGQSTTDAFDVTVVREGIYMGTDGPETISGSFGYDAMFGLGGSDILSGGPREDRLFGGDGDDLLFADSGADRLDGGAGADRLNGGSGSDTFVFARGMGLDSINEAGGADPGDVDVIEVAADIATSDVNVTHVPARPGFNDPGFLISIAGTLDAMRVLWWLELPPVATIEEVRFADGTVWTLDDLVAQAIQNGGAPGLAVPLADQAAIEDAPYSFTVPAGAFADADIATLGDSLAYSARLAGGAALPSWLSFDAATRTFSGTPLNANVGALSIEVTATDESGRSAADVFSLAVQNTNDAPTLANPLADRSVQDAVEFSFQLPADSFVDQDANDSFVWSVAQPGGGLLPTWLSFDAATRTISGRPTAASIGELDVMVTATDSAGAPVSDVFRITVAPAPDQTLTGNSANNTLTGGSGNDTLNGRGGADNMTGLLGDDFYFVDHSGDQVNEAANGGTDTVSSSITYTLGSNVEHLTLTGSSNRNGTGNSLSNTLTGNSGNNVLNGGGGNDILNGGAGADTFVFSHLPGALNADLIQGFTSSDRIHLDNAVMAALGGTGTLSASRFWSSTTGQAHDSSDRVIYNTSTGELWYDANGTAAGGAQLIATLENDPALTASQISVI